MRNIKEGVNRSAILSTFSHLIHPVVSASVYGYERLTSTGVSSLIHWLIRKHEQIEIRLTGKYFLGSIVRDGFSNFNAHSFTFFPRINWHSDNWTAKSQLFMFRHSMRNEKASGRVDKLPPGAKIDRAMRKGGGGVTWRLLEHSTRITTWEGGDERGTNLVIQYIRDSSSQ